MKDHGGCSQMNVDWFQILSETIRIDPRLVIILCVLFLPFPALAQTNLDDLRNKIAVGSTEEKRSALFEIRSLHTEEASRIAVPALSDKIDIVRATAVSSIIFLPHDESLRLLLPLLKDGSEFVRRETAFALGELGEPTAAHDLIENLNGESSIENRSAAAIALGKVGNPEAIEPLAVILKTKPTESQGFLRGAAARSIGEIAQAIRFGKHQPTTPQNFLPDKYKRLLVKMTAQLCQRSSIPPFQSSRRCLKVLENRTTLVAKLPSRWVRSQIPVRQTYSDRVPLLKNIIWPRSAKRSCSNLRPPNNPFRFVVRFALIEVCKQVHRK